jgi:hypothetical protein
MALLSPSRFPPTDEINLNDMTALVDGDFVGKLSFRAEGGKFWFIRLTSTSVYGGGRDGV